MALTQNLALDTTFTPFVLGFVNSYCTNAGDTGDIVAQTGAQSILQWLTNNGVNANDIGGGSQTNSTMGGFCLQTIGGTPSLPFKTFLDTALISGTALLQQPIRWNSNNSVTDVVWGVYLPQTDADSGPALSVGKIMGFGATIDDAASVGSNDPNTEGAITALLSLLGNLGNRWQSFNGPLFTGNLINDLYSTQGLFAKGGFLSYSNINGTWLVYPGA